MKIGQLNLEELDQPYYAVIQLRHQQQGVLHSVVLRPDKVKNIKREGEYGLGELRRVGWYDSAIICLGDTPGDQAAGWQYPENIYVVAILGKAVANYAKGNWECIPLDDVLVCLYCGTPAVDSKCQDTECPGSWTE